jgi:transposase-like protein
VTAAAIDKPKLFPLRQRTGTAAFHLSKAAVDFGYDDLDKLTEKQAVMLLAEAVWGSTTEMPCPHCGTIACHYFTAKELRWKCTCCGSRFSVTSQTVFADRKLSLLKILKIAFGWSNGAAGKPALQLRRDWNMAYATVFTLIQKLREGLVRGFNIGLLAGTHEMDGMDINGRRNAQKRGKPLGGKSAGTPKLPPHLLKPPPGYEMVGPPTPHKFAKKASQPEDRRLLLVMRQRGASAGKGAVATRVAVSRSESTKTVVAMATKFASAESAFRTDEDPAYASFSRLFDDHQTINHSEGYSLPGGVHNNAAEGFNARMRRSAEGIYLNASNKYLTDYAVETAWREDTRRLSTGKKLRHLFLKAMSVGLSMWWRGFTHGKHRSEEFLIEGDEPAKARGRPKGCTSKLPR